jgi:hypothetical protein
MLLEQVGWDLDGVNSMLTLPADLAARRQLNMTAIAPPCLPWFSWQHGLVAVLHRISDKQHISHSRQYNINLCYRLCTQFLYIT